MKNLLLSSSFLLFISLTVSHVYRPGPAATTPAQEIQTDYKGRLRDFAQATQHLAQRASALNASSVESLRTAFRQARLRFKQVEFLAEQLDGEFVRDYLNGAPLPKLERNAPSLNIVAPKGFQPLEELVFDSNPVSHKDEIVALADALADKAEEFAHYQARMPLTDRQVFEAIRFELIRIFTLGVSGFDSPAALASLPEAQAAMEAMYEAIRLYYSLLERQAGEELMTRFAAAISYLEQHREFDTFDRLAFLTQHINPLFEQTLEAQLALGIETYYETSPQQRKHSVNYFATNLFAEDLLNPFYYTRMPSQKYQPEVVALGRTLFFDPVLSSNNQRSCASCHQPRKAFTDGLAKSVAIDAQGTVDRNAPALLNAVYADRYFYDLRSEVLEDQMDHVVADHREFFTSYLDIFEKLSDSEDYQQQFRRAFPEVGSAAINKYTLTTALSAYLVSLNSFDSPFDRYVRGESDQLSEAARRGFTLFMGKAACGTCHFAPLFSGTVPPQFHESETEVLGVPTTPDTLHPVLDPDLGRAGGVLKESVNFYQHSFKTTTVRNVALTAPYMHNGVYETLGEVVDFYNRGGGAGLGLDVPYQTLSADPLGLTESEQTDLVAFMESLTDTTSHSAPTTLPSFANNVPLNNRPVGGKY